MSESPPAMLSPGPPFKTAELDEFERRLRPISNPDRASYRNENASAIATSKFPQLLIVAGPGTGKSFLFMDRIRHWLKEHPGQKIYVSSFVRKLVTDLDSEVQASDLSPAEKSLVTVTTLHSLARSLVERNHGTTALPMGRYIKMIGSSWKDVVWADVLSLHPDLTQDLRFSDLERQFHELAVEDAPWPALRESYFRICRFYNALGFADSILHATEALHENDALNSHRLWIIDEFQDFNAAEERLLATCLEGALGVLLAGDDDQALYQDLKASHPGVIRAHYADDVIAKGMLPYCGRCSQHICSGATTFLARTRGAESIRKVFLPLRLDESAVPIRAVACSTTNTAVDYILSFIETNREAIGQRRTEILEGSATDPFLLILSYQRDVGAFYGESSERLEAAVEEWRLERIGPAEDYFRVLAYNRHAVAPADNFALRKVLHYELEPLGTVASILHDALQANSTLEGVSHPAVTSAGQKSHSVASTLRGDMDAAAKARTLATFIQVENVDRLAADLDAFPVGAVESRDEDHEEVETAETLSPVEKLTMVGAKGLSADHVVLLGFDQVNMSQASPQLFFVAMTRARSSLHLLTAFGARGANEPHDFLEDIPETECEHLKFTASAGEEAFDSRSDFLGYFEARRRAIARTRNRGRRSG